MKKLVFWNDLMGTSILRGCCRTAWDENKNRWAMVRASDLPYYYADYENMGDWEGHTLRQDITAEVLDKDWSVKETVTIPAGTKVAPYATDNKTFLVLYLSDGRAIRVPIELRDFSEMPEDVQVEGGMCPWMIAGEWQDKLFEGIRYSG